MSEAIEDSGLSAEQLARAEALRVARAVLLDTGVLYATTAPEASELLTVAEWIIDGRLHSQVEAALADEDGLLHREIRSVARQEIRFHDEDQAKKLLNGARRRWSQVDGVNSGSQSGSAPLSESLDGVGEVHDRIGEVADRSDDCLEKVAFAINLGIKDAFDRHDRVRLEREERPAREGDAVGDVVVDGHDHSSSGGDGQPVRAAEVPVARTLDGAADTEPSGVLGGGAAAGDCAAAPEGGEES